MYLKNNKGVTLLALTITVIVMMIVTGIVVYNTKNHIKIEKTNKLYNDIENINTKIEDYYLKYGDIPTLGGVYCNKTELETLLNNNKGEAVLYNVDDITINPNDGDEYYIIDLEKLNGLTLNYGYGNDYMTVKNSSTTISTEYDELYIINQVTHQVYYPSGIIYNDVMYYSYNIDDNKAVNDVKMTYSNGKTTYVNDQDVIGMNNLKIFGNTIKVGNNLFDNMNFTEGYNLANNGTLSAKQSYKISDFVSVVANANYFIKMTTSTNKMFRVCCYDDNKNFLSTLVANYSNESGIYKNKITMPEKAEYIKISCGINDNDIEIYQLETDSNDLYNLKSLGELVTDENDANYNKYKIPIKVSGKNIFNLNDFASVYSSCETAGYQGNFIDEFDGEIDVYKIFGLQMRDHIGYKYMKGEFKENTQYTFSIKIYDVLSSNTPGLYMKIYYTDKTSTEILANDSTRKNNAGKWTTYNVISENGKTIDYIHCSYATGGAYSYIKHIQIEEGTEATNYEQYKEEIINIYLDEPLRKVGDKVDYIDFRKQKVFRNVGSSIEEGKEVYYEMSKTTETIIKDMPKIPQYVGMNVITIQSEVIPSDVEYGYYEINRQ